MEIPRHPKTLLGALAASQATLRARPVGDVTKTRGESCAVESEDLQTRARGENHSESPQPRPDRDIVTLVRGEQASEELIRL